MHHTRDVEAIVIAAHTLTRIAALRIGDQTPSAQWRALSILRSEGPLRVGELARLGRTTQPGTTRLVAALAHEGLVERSADDEDSRATVVSITAAGRDALAAWRERLGSALEPLFDGLDDADWHTLSRAAQLLTTRADSLLEASPR